MSEGPQVNVLMVDDQPAKLLSYEAVLSELGENLIKAGSAREALDLLLKHDIAVILIDVCMPEFDGFDLVDMIRQHPRFDATAIILVSAVFMSDVDRIRGYERGAMDYVSVPIVPELLRAKVATFAELYRKTRQLELLNAQLERRVVERTAELEASSERVRAGEERLSLALAAGAVATWNWEIADDRVSGDERLATFFGADPAAVASGLPLETLLASVHEEDRPVMLARLQAMIEGGDDYVMEFRVAADRTPRWLRARGRVERDGKGNARVIRGALTDITEAVRLEQALRDADRRKDHFLAVLAHELRNPLASIRNVVELMRSKTEDASVVAWGRDVIERQVGQLVRLVDDLLDVSRITEGRLRLRSEPVDLGVIAASALETSRPLIDRRRHAVNVRLGERPVWVLGDPVRLAQIVINLLNNAAKFQEPGGEITLAVEREGELARVSVADRGHGIPPELLPSVFDMFPQTAGPGNDSEGGLGLGLSLVRRLVELHAGSTEVRSEGLGRGSEFIVRLPCLKDVHRPSPTVAPSRASAKVVPQRILVVDDNHDAAESLGILLRRAGHQVVLANEGESALRAATQLRPSVVLLDLGLPGMSGLEVCRRLREQGLQDALMVAVTGYGQEADRTRTREAGFDSHLVKPVAFEQLAELVASAPGPAAASIEQ